MLAKAALVTVLALDNDNESRERQYTKADIERMTEEILASTQLSIDGEWRSFCKGFAAAIDVMSSGQLSDVFPVGCLIRAFIDVKEPEKMDGMITDVVNRLLEGSEGGVGR